MNTRFKIALFVISLVLLLVFQSKLVMPWVYKVVASDLFLEDSDDRASQTAVSTEMTRLAYTQCNNYITNDLGSDFSIVFPKEPRNSWARGGYEYVINADIQITPKNAPTLSKRYACNIRYTKKSDKSGVADASNWSVDGLSGLNDL